MKDDLLKFPDNSYFQLRKQSYVVRKSQEAGEKDIEFFVKTADCEGVWFFNIEKSTWYFPEQESHKEFSEQKGVIYETGMSIDSELLEGKMIFYHTHPEIVAEDVIKKGKIPKLTPPENLKKEEKFQRLLDQEMALSHLCFPSLQDLITFTELKDISKKLSSLDAKILSPKGVTSFKVLNRSIFGEYNSFYDNLWTVLEKTGLQIEEKPEGIEIYSPILEICEELSKSFQNKLELSFQQTSLNSLYIPGL
ncbi:hypothetical protein HY837_03355 [archaeon]|nr:hypothetical protein [archaeon]